MDSTWSWEVLSMKMFHVDVLLPPILVLHSFFTELSFIGTLSPAISIGVFLAQIR